MILGNYIESKPDVMLGKPVIIGTRITVEALLRKIADGYSISEIVEMYPRIGEKHILASINYAAADYISFN